MGTEDHFADSWTGAFDGVVDGLLDVTAETVASGEYGNGAADAAVAGKGSAAVATAIGGPAGRTTSSATFALARVPAG